MKFQENGMVTFLSSLVFVEDLFARHFYYHAHCHMSSILG